MDLPPLPPETKVLSAPFTLAFWHMKMNSDASLQQITALLTKILDNFMWLAISGLRELLSEIW